MTSAPPPPGSSPAEPPRQSAPPPAQHGAPPPNQPVGQPAPGSTAATEPPKPKRAISVGQILAGILLVLVVIFVVENTRTVKVRLIGPEVQAPLAVALLIAAVAGGLIAALLRYRRVRHAEFKAEAKAARAERKARG